MLRRGRVGEGWLGEIYAGEDAQGRLVRLSAMSDFSSDQRDWLLARHRFMTHYAIEGAHQQLGIEFVNGTLYWVDSWRAAVQLSVVLKQKHMPNAVIMSVAYSLMESLYSAEQNGVSHGCLDPNGIWLGRDGRVWIDGYGEPYHTATAQKDVYDVGRFVIEMFLGECPFPIEDPVQAKQELMTTGVELKALGLPGKIPRQILQMVLWDPEKRPTIEQVLRRWKIAKAKILIAHWVKQHFESYFTKSLPEDRIPVSDRIAPLPFPAELMAADSIPLIDIGPLESDSSDLTSVMESLEDDETVLRERVPLDETQEIALPSEESMTQEDESTQEMEFFSDVETSFFAFEETSVLVDDSSPIVSLETEDAEIELDSILEVPDRKPWSGVVWLFMIGFLTAFGLYWTIPSMPNIADASTATNIVDTGVPIRTLLNVDSFVSEHEDSEPEPPALAVTKPIEVKPAAPIRQKKKKRSTPAPKKSQPKSPVKKVVGVTEDTVTETVEPESVEGSEPTAVVSVSSDIGVVQVKGDMSSIRFKKDGKDYRGSGELPVGVYEVFVTFEGFSEFQLTPLTVKPAGTHTIQCNAIFATCQYK